MRHTVDLFTPNSKSMVSYCQVHVHAQNLEYFENIVPKRSKLSSFIDTHHILHLIDFIFGQNGKRICNRDISFLAVPLVWSIKDE